MAQDLKQFIISALGIFAIIGFFALLITPVVFVSGCVNGTINTNIGTQSANTSSTTNATTQQQAETPPQATQTDQYNQPQAGISDDNILSTTTYIINPEKVKPAEVNVKIEVKNKGEKAEIGKDIYNNIKEQGNVNFKNIQVKVDETSSGLSISSSKNERVLNVNNGESTNASFTFKIDSEDAKVGTKYTFNYFVKTGNNKDSYISLSNTQLTKGDFVVSVKNESGNYSILVDSSVDFGAFNITFKPIGNTTCNDNICTKRYNVTYTLKNKSISLEDVSLPKKEGGSTDVNVLSSDNEKVALNKSKDKVVKQINITVNVGDISNLEEGSKKDFPSIGLSINIGQTKILNYKSREAIAELYITGCNNDNNCPSNKVCKDNKCIEKGSSESNSGQV